MLDAICVRINNFIIFPFSSFVVRKKWEVFLRIYAESHLGARTRHRSITA